MKKQFDIDNMYCGIIRRGDILLYELEKGHEQAVVVLQDNVLNESLDTVICAYIEPHSPHSNVYANEVLLHKEETGLGMDGICMLHKVTFLDRRGMIAKKGELNSERMFDIYKAFDINCGRFRDQLMDLE